MTVPIILHLPHDSTFIPEDLRQDFLLSDQELQAELNWITDHTTDLIFQQAFPDAQSVVFPVSRFVADPECFSEDSQEPMSQVGMGVTLGGLCVSHHLSSPAKLSVRSYWSDTTILITKSSQRQLKSLSWLMTIA